MRGKHSIIFRIVLLVVSLPIFAADDEETFPTAFLTFDGSYVTHKSLAVESNDTGIGVNYAFGFNAGVKREVGVVFRTNQSNITFALNESSINTTWQDSHIRYRFGPFYTGVSFNSVSIVATKEGEDLADLVGTGYGGSTGIALPTRKGSWHLDISYATIGTVRELNQKVVTVGPRMDVDLGMAFDVTKRLVDFILGARYRTSGLTVDGVGGVDTISSMYLGFSFSSVF